MQTDSSKPAVVYIRFSNDKQSDGDSVNRQTKFCKANDLTVVLTILDEGESAFHGMHLSNGNLGKFLLEAEKGSYRGHVFVFDELSRLSRLGVYETFGLVIRLLNAGLIVRDMKSGITIASTRDLNRPDVSLVMSVGAVMGHMHSEELSRKLLHRRKAEREQAAATGLAFTPVAPGWISAKLKGKPAAIPAFAETVSLIFDLAASGLGAKAIVRRLIAEHREPFGRKKKWTAEYVTKILCNRATLGYFQPHKLTIETRPSGKQVKVRVPVDKEIELYPAVITMTQWKAARAAVDSRNRVRGRASGDRHADGERVNSVLSPLVYDATRGRVMNFYQKAGGPPYLVTKWDPKSKSNYLRYDVLERAFLKFLETADWKAIAGHGQSAEEKEAETALNIFEAYIERSTRAIAGITTEMEEAEAEKKFKGLAVLAARVEDHRAKLLTLATEKTRLEGILEGARARSEALAAPEKVRALIDAKDPATRLALKAAIARRVARIEVHFHKEPHSPVARVTFTNGATRFIFISSIGPGASAYDPATLPPELRKYNWAAGPTGRG